MGKIVIFGAGVGGTRAVEALKDKFSIQCLSDNDPKKHGTRLLDLPVIPPAELPRQEYDLVVIASLYANEIRAQLLNIGVDCDRIHVFDVDHAGFSLTEEMTRIETEVTALQNEVCEKIIIFGTGTRARMAWEELCSRFEILCFADNDAKKHGTVFLGRRIIKPTEIIQHPFDKIVVASIYTREILPQLKEIGVERQRIQCY